MALTAQPQGRHLTAPPGWTCPIGVAAAMCVGLTMPPTVSTLPEPGERDEVQAWLLNRQFPVPQALANDGRSTLPFQESAQPTGWTSSGRGLTSLPLGLSQHQY
ncbi:MAG: hypothetical protein WCG47_32745, partial [Dermatophilaceae bacterium]